MYEFMGGIVIFLVAGVVIVAFCAISYGVDLAFDWLKRKLFRPV